MKTYAYYSKFDKSSEIIGRVNAMDLHQAREFISQLKQLPIDEVLRLFEIKTLSHGDNI
jgi:hypothetical protein